MLQDVVKRAINVPLALPQLVSSAKSFEDNFIIGSRTLNDWGLHEARVKAAHRVAERRRQRLLDGIDADDRMAFERDGFVVKENFLPPDAFARLKDEVLNYRGTMTETFMGDSKVRQLFVTKAVLERIPVLSMLIDNPIWRGVTAYVGASAIPAGVQLQSIFARARQSEMDPQNRLHADTFHPTAKAWFYLVDVHEDRGPFCYVPGSHRLTPERIAWERRKSLDAAHSEDWPTREGSFRVEPGEEVELGLSPPRYLAVPANTLVVADTFGFHARTLSACPATRIEIHASVKRMPFLSSPLLESVLTRSARKGYRWETVRDTTIAG